MKVSRFACWQARSGSRPDGGTARLQPATTSSRPRLQVCWCGSSARACHPLMSRQAGRFKAGLPEAPQTHKETPVRAGHRPDLGGAHKKTPGRPKFSCAPVGGRAGHSPDLGGAISPARRRRSLHPGPPRAWLPRPGSLARWCHPRECLPSCGGRVTRALARPPPAHSPRRLAGARP